METNMTNTIEIFFAADDNFARHLCAAMASILDNANNDDCFNFYILDDNISDYNKNKIINLKKIKEFNVEFIKVDNELFKNCPQSVHCPQITKQTYYRYIIPKIKPELKKVLYLDCDILAVSSLSDLWSTDLGDKYCAAVQGLNDGFAFMQNAERVGLNVTFNAGVMLINNEKWVKENVTDLLFKNTIELAKQDKLWLQDQDALNYTFKENIVWLNPRFNYQQTMFPTCYHPIYSKAEMKYADNNKCLIHYNSNRKPWNRHCNFYSDLYEKYLFQSGYYFEYWKLIFPKIVQNIFSLTNIADRKVITLFGVKIKFKKDIILHLLYRFLSIKSVSNYIDKKYYKLARQHKYSDFAVLKYDYTPKGYCYYNFGNIVNIGDYIQSLAARQYVGENCIYVDRDGLNFYDGKPVSMITNGWFHIYDGNDNISEKIDPLFVSYHINNPGKIKKYTLEYLKKYEPIGCRDYATRNFLLTKGIKAYFSSCLTTTLYKKYLKENTERHGVIYCDCMNEEYKCDKKIEKTVESILKKYSGESMEHVSHLYPLSLTHDERFAAAEALLQKYAKAKLVITKRIHCALPCLALNTPVILVINSYDKARFAGIADLLNVVGYDKNKKFMCEVKKDESGFVTNPDEYIKYAQKLELYINEWLRGNKDVQKTRN